MCTLSFTWSCCHNQYFLFPAFHSCVNGCKGCLHSGNQFNSGLENIAKVKLNDFEKNEFVWLKQKKSCYTLCLFPWNLKFNVHVKPNKTSLSCLHESLAEFKIKFNFCLKLIEILLILKQILTTMWLNSRARKIGVSKADFWALVSVVAAEIAIGKGINSPHSKYVKKLIRIQFILMRIITKINSQCLFFSCRGKPIKFRLYWGRVDRPQQCQVEKPNIPITNSSLDMFSYFRNTFGLDPIHVI